MDIIHVILGFLATISMITGLLNNGFIFFYLRKKLPIRQTAFDLVVADCLIVICLNTFLSYFLYLLGLIPIRFPYWPSAILSSLNQVLYMTSNASGFAAVFVKYLYLKHGVMIYDTSDTTIRRLSWIGTLLLTLIYVLINNYGPRQSSLFLLKFIMKDDSVESPLKTGIGVPLSVALFFAFATYVQYIIGSGYHPDEDKTSHRFILLCVGIVALVAITSKTFLDTKTFVHVTIIMGLAARGQIIPLVLFRNNENLKNFIRKYLKSVLILPK